MTRFLNGLHDSLANTSLAGVLSPPCSSLCSNFKSLTLTINNLPLEFQMSQQSFFTAHRSVSRFRRLELDMSSERAQLCPLTPGPVLHPLISRETWCKATELKHCQAPQTYERCDFCPQQARYEDNRLKSQMMSPIDVAVSCPPPHTFLPVMLKRTRLWLSIDRRHLLLLSFPFTIIPLNLHPQPYIFLSLSYHCCMCCHAARQQYDCATFISTQSLYWFILTFL